jgi:hypothetical protein
MSVAYHLLTHRDPAQIRRLLRALWHPDNTYVIHHDRRRPASEHAALAALADEFPGLIFQKPIAVLWGRFSLYAAQHEGLRLALASGRPWTHWVNLSGQCYPLRSADYIQQHLGSMPQTSYVNRFDPHAIWGPNCVVRMNRYYFDSAALERVLSLPGLGRRLRRLLGWQSAMPHWPLLKRKLPTSFTWHGGDNWVILSRANAEHLIHSPAAKAIVRAFRHTMIPDESVIPSVIHNGPFAAQTISQHLRAINWRPGLASPLLYSENDLPALAAAADSGALFARKFDLARHPAIFDQIDSTLLSLPRA